VIIGSRARTDHLADEWSDLDIVLFVTNPQAYIDSAGWVKQIGEPCLTFVERTPGEGWERRVLFDAGLDADFAINPAQWLEHMATNTIPPDMADVLRRGTRSLVDKDGHLAQIAQRPLPAASPFQHPTEAEFLNVVNDFWYHTDPP
jgi:aminoglycoside 6-adenylyltransferase